MPKPSWSQKLDGKLTDLAVANATGKILVSELIEGGSENKTQVSLFSPSGKRLWRTQVNAPVRSQTFSPSGGWIILSTYQEELIRLNPVNGAVIWKIADTALCRPFVLEKSSSVLCYHDDDASPGLVFEVFNDLGKKISELKANPDSLLLKISPDESRILVGFVKGHLWMLGADFKKIWEKQLDGEISDAALPSSSTAKIEAAVLLNSVESGQSLVTLTKGGRIAQKVPHPIPLQQLETGEDGSWISVYGNGARGQFVAQYETEPNLTIKWSYHSPKSADYNLKMDLTDNWTLLGFEDTEARTRFSHVVALDRLGNLQWHVPLPSTDGAYLYSTGVSTASKLIVIGTDNGTISAYPLQPTN